MTQIEVVVNGRWLSLESLYGDVEMSTIWPGGSDQLSWTPATRPFNRYRGGEKVQAMYGGVCVWAGQLLEPDPSQGQMTATGAFREAAGYVALDGSGAASNVPDTAIDQAISRGLRWTRPASIRNSAINIDLTQGPVKVDELLNMWGQNNGHRWTVNPARQVLAADDPTTPTYMTLPMTGGLGYALDNYASTLVGRYFDSGTSTYKTVTVTDATADGNHGHVEDIVDLTDRGPIGSGAATGALNNILELGRAVPSRTAPLEVTYGEILTMGGTPVALETVAAGTMVRIPGGFELAQRLNGQMYLDVPIGRTQLAGGKLTLTPASLAVGNLADAIAAALSKTK